MSILNLTGEESNYYVLEKILDVLKKYPDDVPTDIICLCNEVELFLAPKRKIDTELDLLTHMARHGDRDAAVKLIKKMTEMNDGP